MLNSADSLIEDSEGILHLSQSLIQTITAVITNLLMAGYKSSLTSHIEELFSLQNSTSTAGMNQGLLT